MWRSRYAANRVLAVAVAASCLLAGGDPADAQPGAVVTDIRAAQDGAQTRFVLVLDRSVPVSVFALADPFRVVIDLPEVGWRLPAKPLPTQVGLLERLRYGLFQAGHSRLVIDLREPAAIQRAFVIEPETDGVHRMVVDLVATSRDTFLAQVRQPPLRIAALAGPTRSALTPPTHTSRPLGSVPADSSAVRAPSPSLPASEARVATEVKAVAVAPFGAPLRKPKARNDAKRVIVLDPGHGGADPGSIGINGTYEKHVTLAMAREIRQQLERSGRYRVLMTRDRDVFLRLPDRVSFAREANADLFVSIHADTISNNSIRGPSVYTLSEKASDKEAADLAERENKADIIAGVDLTHESPEVTTILIDLAQRETMNQSAQFAASLVNELRRETNVLRNTHRFAGFAVLKAPDVPSVLLELGFLSNRTDAKALASKAYRSKLAAGMVRAIDRHFLRTEQARR